LIDAVALELIHKWYDEFCFIYDNSVVNSDEDENETILETIETAVKQYGCRMLMIDNLMTAIADDLSSDLYRQQSAFVRKLAEMAKRYDVIILLIVHPRKRTGKTFDNDEVAGSSNITNLADVVMNYSLPKDDNDEHPDRILQITKNRLNGRTNYDGIPLWYEEKSKRILEGIGIDNKEFGWSIDNFFNQIPNFGEEEEIEF
jgi:RecA-family ATPase